LHRSAIRVLGAGCLLCALALPLAATPNMGRISGLVKDSAGTPQMGATVLIAPEQMFGVLPAHLLTNDLGRFSTSTLPAGLYSVQVTLAGFLPAIEQHVLVLDQQTTPLEIVLGSVFASIEKLRRQPDQMVAPDDWTWVLRTSLATRSVLQWQDSSPVVLGGRLPEDGAGRQENHGRLDMTSGSDQPGSIANLADAPAAAFAYEMATHSGGQFLMAGQFAYDGFFPSNALAAEWLPSGQAGAGPVTTFVIRESHIGPEGPVFRGMRVSHDASLALSDRVSLRYGGEYVMAGFFGTTTALRPRGQLAVKLASTWQASAMVATHPWDDASISQDALASTLAAFDAFPTLMMRHGDPVFEKDLHEELAVEHVFSKNADMTAAVFHDDSSHTAVIGRGVAGAPDFVQDYLSEAFAYDGGASRSDGVRMAYRRKWGENIGTTVVYSYAGALAPKDFIEATGLRSELETQYRHSLAASFTATAPHMRTKFTASYKWLDGRAVSQQDAYGESLYGMDPYLTMRIRQPLPSCFPGHMEVHADAGNLLAQGYVPLATANHGNVVLIPSYRYVRGGLSVQF